MDLNTAVQPGLGLPKGYSTPPSKAEIRRVAQGNTPAYSPAYPVDVPTPEARKIAFEASAVDRQPKNKGGKRRTMKSRRRKGSKKTRKTRGRGRRITKSRK
jgi:hypothetical protein